MSERNDATPTIEYGVTLAGRVGGAAFNLLALLIMVRVLPPERLGSFSLAISLIAIGATIAEAGLRTGFVGMASRNPNGTGALRELLGASLSFMYLAGAGLGLIALAATGPLGRHIFREPIGHDLIALIGVGIIAHNAFHLATAPSQARRSYGWFSAYQMLWSGLRLAGVGWLALRGITAPTGYVAVHVGSLVLSAITVMIHDPASSLAQMRGRWRRAARAEVATMLRRSHWVTSGTLLASLMAQLGVVALGYWSTLAEVGRFAAVLRLVQIFKIGVSALWAFLLPRVLALEPRGLRGYLSGINRRLPAAVGAGIAAVGLGALALPLVIPAGFGVSWVVFALLGAGLFADSYGSLLSMIFLNLGSYRVVVMVMALRVAVAGALAMAWIPTRGAVGAALAVMIAELFNAVALRLLVARSLAGRGAEVSAPVPADGEGARS